MNERCFSCLNKPAEPLEKLVTIFRPYGILYFHPKCFVTYFIRKYPIEDVKECLRFAEKWINNNYKEKIKIEGI